MPIGIPAPQFKIDMFWVKWVESGIGNVDVVKQAWDMLANVGSPGHLSPIQVPAWESIVGPHNLQVEVTAHQINASDAFNPFAGLNVRLRVQVCPRNTSGLPPLPIPPCGQLLDSGASVFAPAKSVLGTTFSVLLPIWQLQMWSENIDLHLEIVDVDGTVYNCLVPYYDNAGYRADDFYVPINVKTPAPTFSITLHVQNQQGVAQQGANVNLT